MPNHALLDHILGDYSDKLKSIPSAPLEELTAMINDLSQVSYSHNDGKNTIQAVDLWEAALTNPNLTVDNLEKLFPLVFRPEQYSVRQHNPLLIDSKLRSEHICKNLIKLNFDDDLWLSLFKNLLDNPQPFTKSAKILNKKTGDLIKGLAKENLPNLNKFMKDYNQLKLKSIPNEQLLQCTKVSYRTYCFDQFYAFNISGAEVKVEINNRKHTTPKIWKDYTTHHFLPFFIELQPSIQKAKLERRDFFKLLKNRLWSSTELIKENEEYLKALSKMEEAIKAQKELIQDKVNKLKADSIQKTD